MEKIGFTFGTEANEKIIKLARQSEEALYIVLLGVVGALLNRYTGNTDIVVGSPVFRQEEEGYIETCINTAVAIGMRIEPDMTFKEVLLQVRERVEEAEEYQDYPISILAEQLNREYLFDTVVLLENIHDRDALQGVEAHLEMVFGFGWEGEVVKGNVAYNKQRFSAAAATRILRHLEHLVEEVCADVNRPLSEMEILSREEKGHLIDDFNNTDRDFGGAAHKGIDGLFARRARRCPDGIAVVDNVGGENRHISYGELWKTVANLAVCLGREKGRFGSIFPLIAEPSLEMIVGILGIIASGSAYLPIAPDYPEERTGFILADGSVGLMVASAVEEEVVERIKGDREVVYLCSDGSVRGLWGALNTEEGGGDAPFIPTTGRGDAAYVIYTSGSTGNPKGVVVEHGNVVNLVHGLEESILVNMKSGNGFL